MSSWTLATTGGGKVKCGCTSGMVKLGASDQLGFVKPGLCLQSDDAEPSGDVTP